MPQHNENVTTAPTLPEFWPAGNPPQMVRPVWIPWPIAVLLAPLFWLMPRRMGPHFAAAGWWAAIAGHLVWTTYGIACFVMLARGEQVYSPVAWLVGCTPGQHGPTLLPVPSFWESVRAPLSSLANEAFKINQVGLLVSLLLVWLLMEAGLIAMAAMLMSYIATEERTRHLLARTIRLVLWSSTSLTVLGLAILGIGLISERPHVDSTFNPWPVHATMDLAVLLSQPAVGLAKAIYGAFFLWLILRGGDRRSRPTTGHIEEPQKPVCESCGYRLTGLSAEGTCPECGTPVADSLPDRRQPSPFAAAHGWGARLWAFLLTVWAVFRDREFFAGLRTLGEYPAARCFALWMCILSGIVATEVLAVLNTYCYELLAPDLMHPRWHRLGFFAAWSIRFGLGMILLVGVVVLISTRFGRRPVQRYAIGVFYWSAWLLPAAVSLGATIFAVFWLLEPIHAIGTVTTFLGTAVGLLCILPVLKAFGALRRAIRGVRFANG